MISIIKRNIILMGILCFVYSAPAMSDEVKKKLSL
jgi:hypothetical protein